MSYAGPNPRLSTPQDLGLHLISHSPVVIDHYRNGVRVERLTHPSDYTGGYLALVMFTHAGLAVTCRWDRIEYRDAPGGALLGSDGFSSLAAWTVGDNGALFVADSGYAKVDGSVPGSNAAVLYQAMPGGTAFIEAIGLSIEGDPRMDADSSSWLGFMAFRDAPAGNSPFVSPLAWLMLLRNNGESKLNEGIALAQGWTVGMVRIST